MNGKQSDRLILVIFLGLGVAGFVVWVGGLFVVWLLLSLAGMRTDLWAMIEALSTAVAAAAVLSAGFVAYRELAEAASSRHVDVADRLFAELNSRENIAARRWVFQNLDADPEKGLRTLDDTGRDAVKQTLNSLDRVAFLTQSSWIPDEMIMPWMNPMIVKTWAKLEPYVDYESRRRNEPDYYRNARELAERCRTWRAENLPEAEITWVKDAL